jgi:hypothetical protein
LGLIVEVDDASTREGQRDEPLTAAELLVEKGKQVAFFSDIRTGDGDDADPTLPTLSQKRKRNEKLLVKAPRLSMVRFMRRVNATLNLHWGSGLESLQSSKRLKELQVFDGCRHGFGAKPAPNLKDFGAEPCPRSFSVSADQEQSQNSAMDWLMDWDKGLNVCGVKFSDWFHRCWNDIKIAVAMSGLEPIYQAAILIFNIGYGPWDTSLFFRQFVAQVETLPAILDSNSPLVIRFWKRHLRLNGLLNSGNELTGPAARKRFIQELAHKNVVDLKGGKVAPSKWLSVTDATESWRTLFAKRSLGFAQVCISRGIIKTEEDLFAKTRVASSSIGAKPAEFKSRAAALRAAKNQVKALQDRTKGIVEAATKLMADEDVINGIMIMFVCVKPVWTEFKLFSTAAEGISSEEQVAALSLKWCKYSWMDALKKTFGKLSATDDLAMCGLDLDLTKNKMGKIALDSGTMKYQDGLARCIGSFTERTRPR